ncbi:hypothetical protein C2E23DRAFT_887696 [Lenzites betulinus]|nr:hypothetical protein C2E23DRAFT_887696 [Lenzites betulinus]
MPTNGFAAGKYACKCLNIRIHAQPTTTTPPPVEAGFTAVYAADQGICVAHTEVTLRSRSKPVPDAGSPEGELSRYTTVTCLVCGVPTYRVAQRITPDLINEVGPVLPTDDWVEKELLKSSSGWIEVYGGCLTDDELAQAEKSAMYSDMFSIVLPGSKPPSASEDGPAVVPNARGPSEQGKKHLPDLPALFLPPPFTPAHIVFTHFSSLATERAQRLRDEAEEYIAQVTQQKVAEVLKAEAALKQEVNLVWSKFREGLQLIEENGAPNKAALPVRRRGSVSGHARTVSSPVPGTSASVRINSFVPTPGQPQRPPMHHRTSTPSALSASLKVSGFHYPEPPRQTNGNTSPARRSVDLTRRTSPTRSDRTRVDSPSTASSRTMALSVDAEASIREAYRREMDERKDIATSFRYVMDIESQMEQHRLEEEAAEEDSAPVASTSQVTAEAATIAENRGRSPRVQKSAFKHSQQAGGSKPVANADGAQAADAPENKETNGKGKRKVTFDVQPEVAIIKDDGASEQPASSSAFEDPIFDMDNETEHSASTRIDVPAEPPKASPAPSERSRTPTRQSHSRSSSNSGLPQMLVSLRPASLPAPSAMRPPVRHIATEPAERTRSLRESLLTAEANSTRPDVVDSPIAIEAPVAEDEEDADPREAEIMRLVAASVPSHRSGWKKNSKSWQMFLSRRERKASEAEPDAISEEGSYAAVLDDFGGQPGRNGFNGVADSDATDEDDDDDKWSNEEQQMAQSLPIPIGPLGQHRQSFGIPSYQPKTSLSDRPGVLVPPLRNGTAATSLRRASVRALDPGALDFVVDEDGVDDVESDPETGGKARQRALRILKARDELPAAGMWRSLA